MRSLGHKTAEEEPSVPFELDCLPSPEDHCNCELDLTDDPDFDPGSIQMRVRIPEPLDVITICYNYL